MEREAEEAAAAASGSHDGRERREEDSFIIGRGTVLQKEQIMKCNKLSVPCLLHLYCFAYD